MSTWTSRMQNACRICTIMIGAVRSVPTSAATPAHRPLRLPRHNNACFRAGRRSKHTELHAAHGRAWSMSFARRRESRCALMAVASSLRFPARAAQQTEGCTIRLHSEKARYAALDALMKADGVKLDDSPSEPPLVALGILSTITSFGCQGPRGLEGVFAAALQANRRQCDARGCATSTAHQPQLKPSHSSFSSLVAATSQHRLRRALRHARLEPYRAHHPPLVTRCVQRRSERATYYFFDVRGPARRVQQKVHPVAILGSRDVPSHKVIALADDDIFIQFEHLSADLQGVTRLTTIDEHVLWGLFVWKPYYNNASMSPAEAFKGENWGRVIVSL